MKQLYILILLFVSVFTLNAQIIDIPDPVFKFRLVNTNVVDTNGSGSADSDVDTNNDGEIQVSEAEAVENLIINNPVPDDIISIEGIEAFTNLQSLYIHNNDITSVDLSALTNLTELTLFYTQLSSLDVSSLTNLTRLVCNNNQLSNLNIDGLTNIEILRCNSNSLSALDLSLLTNLTNLSCGYNQINSLNIDGLTNIEVLVTSHNQLSNIDLSLLTNLELLSVSNNQISQLDLTNLTNMTALYCANNQLSTINISDMADLDILHCENNQLTSFELNDQANLTELICHNNEITSLDITNCSNLEELNCSNNQLSILDLSGSLNIEELNVSNNQIAILDVSGNTKIDVFSAYNNQITFLDFSSNTVSFNEFKAFNNALTSINFKNNIQDIAFYDSEIPNFNPLQIWNNPDLTFLCVDDFELSLMQTLAEDENGLTNYAINSYCYGSSDDEYYTIQGKTLIDLNNNGCDMNDVVYAFANLSITNGAETGAFISNASGNFSIPIPDGTHVLTQTLENPSYFSVTPESISVDFPSDTSPFIQDFCITPNGAFNDVEVTVFPIDEARPGFDADYKLSYKNKGTTMISGSIDLTFQDELMDFILATPAEDSQVANSLSWNFTDLMPFESRTIEFSMNINSPMEIPAVNGGDVLVFDATLNTSETDETPEDNNFTLNQTVVNSFDPNDKACLEGSTITPEQVGEYVHYRIRFENTGTASAITVLIKDNIDRTKYDLSSLIPLDASHDFVTRITDSGADYYVEFIFENINLPFDDANNDGYVVFKIRTLDSLVLGDTFENEAEIYFDFNFPIITNVAQTTVATLSTEDFTFENIIVLYPNPTSGLLNLKTKGSIEQVSIYDISGRLVQDISVLGSKSNLEISTDPFLAGTYFMKIKTSNGDVVRKFVKN